MARAGTRERPHARREGNGCHGRRTGTGEGQHGWYPYEVASWRILTWVLYQRERYRRGGATIAAGT